MASYAPTASAWRRNIEPLFFDFECNAGYKIYILGVRDGKKTSQYVCDNALAKMASAFRLEKASPEEVASKIIGGPLNGGRTIACYSTYDVKVLKSISPHRSFQFLNMRTFAKRWINKYYYNEYKAWLAVAAVVGQRFHENKWGLLSTAAFAGIFPPPGYGSGKTLNRILQFRSAIEAKGRDGAACPAEKKRDFHNALRHNRFDVEGMQKLFWHIAQDTGAAEFESLMKAARTEF